MAEWCADHLRNCEGWRSCGLPLSTTSDECAKMFDASLRQIVSWSDCASLGGVMATLTKMETEDPKALLPRCFLLGLRCLSGKSDARINAAYAESLNELEKDAAEYGTPREQKHAKAVALYGRGQMQKAAIVWEEILLEYPTDLLAAKFAHEAYFFMGDCQGKSDSMRNIIHKWKGTEPCYSYLYGMWAFGLEECGEYREAEKQAEKALSMNRFDCWATHAKAHVLEMESRIPESITFLESTEDDWKQGWMIATHNYWHKALPYIEKADYEVPLSIFDNEVCRRANQSESLLDTVDAASLLMRLELEGVNVGDRWKRLPSMTNHVEDHVLVFNDVHIGPSLLRRGEEDDEKKLYDTLLSYTKTSKADNARVCDAVGVSLYEGVMAFSREEYDSAAESLLPVRQLVQAIGGSHAQRDVFTQTLIQACILSKKPENFNMTPTLLNERNSIKPNSPLTERLAVKFHTMHPNEEPRCRL